MYGNGNTAVIPTDTGDNSLGIDKLSIDYDYLIFKINDYISSIQLQTKEICQRQNELISEGIIKNVINENILKFKVLLESCEELENNFDMLDQIQIISESFAQRLREVTKNYIEIKKSIS